MNINIDISQLQKYRLVLGNAKVEEKIQAALKETVMTTLRETKRNTPHKTGTLRREWNTTNIEKSGKSLTATMYNDTKYAPYVEYGHRTRDKKGFVTGQYMMTKSVEKVQKSLHKIMRKYTDAMARDLTKK